MIGSFFRNELHDIKLTERVIMGLSRNLDNYYRFTL